MEVRRLQVGEVFRVISKHRKDIAEFRWLVDVQHLVGDFVKR